MHKASKQPSSPPALATTTGVIAVVAALIATLPAGAARADGAFPDAQGVLLPADRPNEIMLATTFGVVVSIDAGQTWTYSCEQPGNGALATFYQVGPPPRDRLFAKTDIALIYSDDRGCTWGKAQGMLAGKAPVDYFPDTANADRVWAVRGADTTTGGSDLVVESTDGGGTFPTVRFTAAVGDGITGVELARSDANTAYVTLRSGSNFAPKLAVTKNNGASWDTRDLSTTIGNVGIRLVAIDPTNPSKIFLRITTSGAAAGDGIALSLDGGMTFVKPQPISLPGGVLSSFVRLSNGTLLAGGVDLVRNVIFRSTDGGMTFTELDAPTVKGLGQRDGRAYIATNNDPMVDGYALGQSNDQGTTWQQMMSFDQVQAISACVKVSCQADCVMKADLSTWAEDVCTATPMPLPVDGGVPTGAGGAAGGAGGAGGHAKDAGVDSSSPEPSVSSGCSCDVRADGAGGGAAIGIAFALALGRRRRRRRSN
jgi:MYXO-CTERM domain-containing protein